MCSRSLISRAVGLTRCAAVSLGVMLLIGCKTTKSTFDPRVSQRSAGGSTNLFVSATTNQLNGVFYTGSEWVAVGQSGTVLTSTDTETWTVQPTGFTGFLAHEFIPKGSDPMASLREAYEICNV